MSTTATSSGRKSKNSLKGSKDDMPSLDTNQSLDPEKLKQMNLNLTSSELVVVDQSLSSEA